MTEFELPKDDALGDFLGRRGDTYANDGEVSPVHTLPIVELPRGMDSVEDLGIDPTISKVVAGSSRFDLDSLDDDVIMRLEIPAELRAIMGEDEQQNLSPSQMRSMLKEMFSEFEPKNVPTAEELVTEMRHVVRDEMFKESFQYPREEPVPVEPVMMTPPAIEAPVVAQTPSTPTRKTLTARDKADDLNKKVSQLWDAFLEFPELVWSWFVVLFKIGALLFVAGIVLVIVLGVMGV